MNSFIKLSIVLVSALITSDVHSASLNINIEPLSVWGVDSPQAPPVQQPAPIFVQVPVPPVPSTNATSTAPQTGILTSLIPGGFQNLTSQLPLVGNLKVPNLPGAVSQLTSQLPVVGSLKIPSLPSFGFLKKRDLMEEYDGYE